MFVATGHRGYWIGGRDDLVEGQWLWMPSRAAVNFTDWAPGEPNNVHGAENCMDLFIRLDWHWNDAPCDTKINFICEMK